MKNILIALTFVGCTNIGVIQTAPGSIAHISQDVRQGVNSPTQSSERFDEPKVASLPMKQYWAMEAFRSAHSCLPELDGDCSGSQYQSVGLPPLTKHEQEVADYVHSRYGK